MISRDEALQHIQALPQMDDTETVALLDGTGRVLAAPVIAALTQPPSNMSAMDGYATRAEDAALGNSLTVIGEAAAGHPFAGEISPGECVRVFTGSVIPDGASHVIIQEDVDRQGETITIKDAQSPPRHIRPAGGDFKQGDVLLPAGVRLGPRQLSICAAGNHATLTVLRRPRIALLANGDELRPPGTPLAPGEIIASNEYSLSALIEAWGGEVVNLGIAPDDPDAIKRHIQSGDATDVFVPVGGASVGDHDHMKTVFADLGFAPSFAKVAVRPGKPTWLSRRGAQAVLGLPGNPASALVCAHLFLRPLIQHMLGLDTVTSQVRARVLEPAEANGRRLSFLRGRLSYSETGERLVSMAENQDSSLLSPFVTANALVERAIDAPALEIGDEVTCLLLD